MMMIVLLLLLPRNNDSSHNLILFGCTHLPDLLCNADLVDDLTDQLDDDDTRPMIHRLMVHDDEPLVVVLLP